MSDQEPINIPFADLEECLRRKDEFPFEQWRLMFHVLFIYTRFKNSRNYAFAAETFKEAVRLGVNPPPDIMRWVADAFDGMIGDPTGKPDIASMLSLKSKPGQPAPFQSARKYLRDAANVAKMAHLIGLYGITPEQAAEMVSRDAEERRSRSHRVSVDTLIDHYYRERKIRGCQTEAAFRSTVHLSEENLSEILREYPADSIPSVLKDRFSVQ